MDHGAPGTDLNPRPHLRTTLFAAAALVAAAVGGLTLVDDGGGGRNVVAPEEAYGSGPSAPRADPANSLATVSPSATTPPVVTAPPVGGPLTGDQRPFHLSVPQIGVDAPVVLLGLRSDERLEVPSTASETGWWSGGAIPGAPGPAVIAGHVNLGDEEGVFARLDRLRPGDEVAVTLDDGQVVRYVIERLERHAKDAFPTDAVYGETKEPELRLITCGGAFDSGSGHYLDNVIVFATLAP